MEELEWVLHFILQVVCGIGRNPDLGRDQKGYIGAIDIDTQARNLWLG